MAGLCCFRAGREISRVRKFAVAYLSRAERKTGVASRYDVEKEAIEPMEVRMYLTNNLLTRYWPVACSTTPECGAATVDHVALPVESTRDISRWHLKSSKPHSIFVPSSTFPPTSRRWSSRTREDTQSCLCCLAVDVMSPRLATTSKIDARNLAVMLHIKANDSSTMVLYPFTPFVKQIHFPAQNSFVRNIQWHQCPPLNPEFQL